MTTAISIQNVSKAYRLGVIGHGTLREDLQSWWAKVRGKEDPNKIIGSKEAIEGDTLWALRDVSFDVEQGSVWGIIGANGAGKSTLLKILSRVTAPTSGQIKVRGRVASLLEVGTGFHPELTGRENIFLNGAILGMTKAEVRKKFDEIVAFSEIEKFIDTPVKRYSSGMYVRLAFAVAAHLDPEILVVDEVLAVGDAAFQKKCLGKMGAVAKEGRTVLFVSHNMGAVRNLCEQALVFRNGRILSVGTAGEQVSVYLRDTEQRAEADIATRKDRSGDGRVRLTSIRVKDALTGGVGTVCAGNPTEFAFSFAKMVNEPLSIGIGFSCFHGAGGEKIFHNDSLQQNVLYQNIPANGSIVCRIPKIPLPPGHYSLDAIIYYMGTRVADHVQTATGFDVCDGDYFHAGKLGNLWGGLVYVDSEWRIEHA